MRRRRPGWPRHVLVRTALPLVAAASLVAAAVPGGPAGASTTTTVPLVPLGPLVMGAPFPGFTATPPGPLNGPLTASTWASYSSDPAAGSEFRQLAASPGFAAYLREWRDARSPTQGMNAVVSLVFRIPEAPIASSFETGLVRSLEAPPAQRWDVPSIPGAQGLTVTAASPVPATVHDVIFRTGIYVVMVQLASSVGPKNTRPFTIADAISASYLQYALVAVAPGGGRPVPTQNGGGGGGGGGGAVVGVVIAALLLAILGAGTWWVLQRRRAGVGASATGDTTAGDTTAGAPRDTLAGVRNAVLTGTRAVTRSVARALSRIVARVGTRPGTRADDDALAAALEALGAVKSATTDGSSRPAVPVPDLAEHAEAAGWLPDPSGNPDRVRYWDGSGWTAHTAVRQR